MKLKAILLALFVFSLSFGQSSNKFLDRKFWKTKPTVNTIKQLIKEGNSITAKNRHAMNGVCYAILEQAPKETVNYIINTGINVNELTHDKRNYIFWAAYKNNLELMKRLLEKGSRTDFIDSAGYSLIQFTAAVGNSNTKIYDFITKNGGNINELDKKGRNLILMYASKMPDTKMLDYFTKKGLDLHLKDKKGNGVFSYACKTKKQAVLEDLISKGVSYKNTKDAFISATAFAHRSNAKLSLDFLTYLEKLGFDPTFISKKGNTALHNIAFSSKDKNIVSYFMNKGLNVNTKNKKGNTPFMNASYMNTKEVLGMFLENAKDINQKNKEGESALTIAVRRNKPEIVSYLIEKGADVTIQDNKKNNLLFHLVDAFRGKKADLFKDKVNILAKQGLKVSKNDEILLHFATKKRKLPVIKELLASGLNVNSKNKNGFSPLHIAVMTAKDTKIIKELMKNGADKTLKTAMNETVYDLALENELFSSKNIDISFLKQ